MSRRSFSKQSRQSSQESDDDLPRIQITVKATGPDGEEFEFDAGKASTTEELQFLVGREIRVYDDLELIDIIVGGSKPLVPGTRPFADLAEPEDGFAIKYRRIGRVQRLLKRARLKSLSKRTRMLRTAVHVAVGKKELLTVRDLLADENLPPACINAVDIFGDTPLMIASIMGEKDIVRLLLKNKAETEHKNPMGRTALMLASEQGHDFVAEALLEHGAAYQADTMYNWKKQIPLRTSPYSLAETNQRDEVMEILADHEAQIAEAEAQALRDAHAEAEAAEEEKRMSALLTFKTETRSSFGSLGEGF